MHRNAPRPASTTRRALLGTGAAMGIAALSLWPDARLFAQQLGDFIEGPPMPDIAPQQLSKHVWLIYATDGFPTPENRGMMASVIFVVTSAGVVVLDSGSSLQIGQMAIRMIKKVTPLPVVAVFNSHYHGDHINGVRNKAGQLVFPKAKIMVPAPEHAFWMDDARMNAAPPAMKGAFENVRRVLASVPADQLVRFEPGAEVAPGITSVAAFGHTPGHTLFTVKSEGQSFAYVADLTNVPSLFARSPDWSVTFDMDKEMARATRRKMFDMVVQEKLMAGGYHFPFPAFGGIEVAGSGYQFFQ